MVRTEPKRPPLFVQAGGSNTRSASFRWDVVAGQFILPRSGRLREQNRSGFPTRGKVEITIVAYGGIGKLNVSLKDRTTLREISKPEGVVLDRETAMAILGKIYEGFGIVGESFQLYRYEAQKGERYILRVSPERYLDAVILDPSRRNFEAPTALDLIDDEGPGSQETLEITAKENFIEFAVAGARYANGVVAKGNKRLGGTGFYSLGISDSDGKVPKLIDKKTVALPNEFVSKEIGLPYLRWDPFQVELASKHPPIPRLFDRRITEALSRPLKARAQ